MCGIFFALSTRAYVDPSPELLISLQQRGPDSQKTLHRTVSPSEDRKVFATFTSTVLSLRGVEITEQPVQDDKGSILCWNGEAWSINGEQPRNNDTTAVFSLLHDAAYLTEATGRSVLAERLSRIAGPYAFVYLDAVAHKIYFGRDLLGRRSLLWAVTDTGDFMLSSISDRTSGSGWMEVDADGVYCIDLFHNSSEAVADHVLRQCRSFVISRATYIHKDSIFSSVLPRLALNKEIPSTPFPILSQHSQSTARLELLLRRSIEHRVLDIPSLTLQPGCQPGQIIARVAILFSGGLDCTVLARLMHDILPLHEPIDLLNVAFENPRIHRNTEGPPYESCPDRMTGRISFDELLAICPGRQWQFVAANIPYKEMVEHREQIIALMYPHNTEMDLSIGAALYFASRASGMLSTEAVKHEIDRYTSRARVLISGLGADELFAGYTRHATAYRRASFGGLFAELDLDLGRLGKRNLGRDDRIISSWGKETRFPYLDEELLAWALEVPITEKCGFTDEFDDAEGSNAPDSSRLPPEKKVLRCLAWKLGMTNVAKEKKRAVCLQSSNDSEESIADTRQIQFGARTAKMETGKTKGTTLLTSVTTMWSS